MELTDKTIFLTLALLPLKFLKTNVVDLEMDGEKIPVPPKMLIF